MTATKVTVDHLDTTDEAQLYQRYQGQFKPQAVYIRLDIESGRVWADWDGSVGGGQSFRSWNGIEQRYSIYPLLASEANRLMDDLAPLFQKVLDGASIEWDGSNHVGRFTKTAEEANEEISDMIYRAMESGEYETVNVWEAGNYYMGLGDREAVAEYLEITGDTTDEEIEAVATREQEIAKDEHEIYVLENLEEYLTNLRDELRDIIE